MKVAVWRYGLQLQLAAQSQTCGGLMAERVIRALLGAGHEVTCFGVTTDARSKMRQLGTRLAESEDLRGYDAAVVLTGPFNTLYRVELTYRRLASLKGRAVYAQWDCDLPFHFGALEDEKFRRKCYVAESQVLADKQWWVLTQAPEAELRRSKARSVGYAAAPFRYRRCVFELAEADRAPLPVHTGPVIPAYAYFGSDRPGRMAELKRWFGYVGAPPLHLYGKWSAASIRALVEAQGFAPTLEYRGPVAESQVTELLNRYAATFFMTDAWYVRADYFTQRVFENVRASVPVLYSDRLQPTLLKVVKGLGVVVEDPSGLGARLAEVVTWSQGQREVAVNAHRVAIQKAAKAMRGDDVDVALKDALS